MVVVKSQEENSGGGPFGVNELSPRPRLLRWVRMEVDTTANGWDPLNQECMSIVIWGREVKNLRRSPPSVHENLGNLLGTQGAVIDGCEGRADGHEHAVVEVLGSELVS